MAHRRIRFERLYLALAQCGEPQYVLAARAHMSPGTLTNIVRGLHAPSDEQRVALATALAADVNDLFAEDVTV
jgi:hypothetical protein